MNCCRTRVSSSTPTGQATEEKSPLHPTTLKDQLHTNTNKMEDQGRGEVVCGRQRHITYFIFLTISATHPIYLNIAFFSSSRLGFAVIFINKRDQNLRLSVFWNPHPVWFVVSTLIKVTRRNVWFACIRMLFIRTHSAVSLGPRVHCVNTGLKWTLSLYCTG